MIRVVNEVSVFTGPEEAHEQKEEIVHVTNHAADDTMIVLVIDGKSYRIVAKDLESAIKNSVNCARH